HRRRAQPGRRRRPAAGPRRRRARRRLAPRVVHAAVLGRRRRARAGVGHPPRPGRAPPPAAPGCGRRRPGQAAGPHAPQRRLRPCRRPRRRRPGPVAAARCRFPVADLRRAPARQRAGLEPRCARLGVHSLWQHRADAAAV
ncbi:hypothetical protein IWW51_006584, partial [Coemansia sp. RSA 2702]